MLDGATVLYGSASELRATLEYDFLQEKNYSYKGLAMDEIIHHLAVFVSKLWQIHIFAEGNTRTTAVFFIKYLRMLGFDITNDIFAENAWYFRNALVRANYNDLKNGVHATTEFLELFLGNLLLDEQNELHNRSMHISGVFKGYKKPDIGMEKPYIRTEKPDIGIKFTKKTMSHIRKLFDCFGKEKIFGRSDAKTILGLKDSTVSELLKKLLEADVIEPISGYGKGKYRFKRKVTF